MSPKTNPLTTLYRLVVMLGVLACGSMAALRYGPKPAELAEMIDGAASMVVEVPGSEGDVLDTELGTEPAPFRSEQAGLAPLPATPASVAPDLPRIDPAVRQASAAMPIELSESAAIDTLEQARLTAPLHSAGATRAAITPWGGMYRASASVPAGGAATGLERQLDALGETPEAAVAALQQQFNAASYR